jgi:CRISPR/Cas system-associated exonuclease Cas4 (RecB family)
LSFDDFLMGLKEEKAKELALELFNSQNINLKTEYTAPEKIAVMQVIAEYLNDVEASEIIKQFIKFFSINMVSYNRKSRKEFVQAIRESEESKEEVEKLKKFLKV